MLMISRTLPLLFVVLALLAAPLRAANPLADHPSPYLALHGQDPVNWRSWQPDVFDEARASNRLVLVSVGYFSCHWCHVMQRQSYQHEQTAAFLNNRYLSVKVDRELQPDLDRRLIEFVREVRGVAGWPLNVFLTPEGYPLTGFTYLPQPEFLRVLQQLDQQWQQKQVEMSAAAQSYFLQGDQNQDFDHDLQVPAERLLDNFISQALQAADELQGGFGNTSKFPNVPQVEALFDSLPLEPDRDGEIDEFVRLTLDSMARLNLQDHVNGGFFRYTTDPGWHTPHFEKMLYDNALLANLYLKAAERWPEDDFATVAERTLDFIEARLRHPEGGYMSSLSAVDREDREGGAYLWSDERLGAWLSTDEYNHLQAHWQKSAVADEYLLRPPAPGSNAVDRETDQRILSRLRDKAQADMPADDKRIASWNALMLSALTRAAERDERFASRARALYDFISAQFLVDDGLIRIAGNAGIAEAVFEDYAFTALALLQYGQQFDDSSAITRARQVTTEAHRLFYRDDQWQSRTQARVAILGGKIALEDLVMHSPLTGWLQAALQLPGLDTRVRSSAAAQLQRTSRDMVDSPFYYGSHIVLRARAKN